MQELSNYQLQEICGGSRIKEAEARKLDWEGAVGAAGSGAVAGGALGAGIGSVSGPPGAVAGGAIGTVVGTFVFIYDYVSDSV